MPTELPTLPWEIVATDLTHWKGSNYLSVVEHLSRYIEIAHLSTTTSREVIRQLKIVYARHRAPSKVVPDKGPQYASLELARFAKTYRFIHQTSNPRYPQSNGEAERAVRTIKVFLS